MEISVKDRCALSCVYCPQASLPAIGVREMTADVFARILRTIPASVDIHFSGYSEPCFAAELGEMLSHADQRGHAVAVFTTCVGMTLKTARAIAAHARKGVYVHVPDSTWAPRRVSQASAGREVLEMVMGSANVTKYIVVGKTDERIIRASNAEPGAVPEGPVTCDRYRQHVVRPDGSVHLCCEDYGGEHVLGNLFVDDYATLGDSAEYKRAQAIRAGQADGLCRRCSKAVPCML